jgi:amidase
MPPRRSYLAAAMSPPGRLRIGVLDRMPGSKPIAREIRDRLGDTHKLLTDLGHECETARIDYDADAFNESTIRLWATTLGHFMDVFAHMTGRKIGPKTVEAVTLETYRYGKALRAFELEWAMGVQNTVSRAFGALMRRYDVLLTPGLGRDVAKLGELDQNAKNLDLIGWWKHIIVDYASFTPMFNTTGQPAIMLPLWQAKSGLPLAMQFVGRLSDEETLYSLASQLEQAQPWSGRRPANYA